MIVTLIGCFLLEQVTIIVEHLEFWHAYHIDHTRNYSYWKWCFKLTRCKGEPDMNPRKRMPFWCQSQSPLLFSLDNHWKGGGEGIGKGLVSNVWLTIWMNLCGPSTWTKNLHELPSPQPWLPISPSDCEFTTNDKFEWLWGEYNYTHFIHHEGK